MRAQEAAAVVDVHRDAGVGVRDVGVIPLAQVEDGRVDLDRVDVFRAVVERGGDVVPRAGADDQHLFERRAAGIAIQQVRQRVAGAAVTIDAGPSAGGRCCWC